MQKTKVLRHGKTSEFQSIRIFGYDKQKARSMCLSEIVADFILYVNPFTNILGIIITK